MKIYMIVIAVLISLCGMVSAAELTNPGTIADGETFVVGDGDILYIDHGPFIIQPGGKLIVEPGGALQGMNQPEIVIDNGGSLELGGTFYGDSLFVRNYGNMQVTGIFGGAPTSFLNYNNLSVLPGGAVGIWYLTNNGTIDNAGHMAIYERLTNNGMLNNLNTFSTHFDVGNEGTINNTGVFNSSYTVEGSGEIYNHGMFNGKIQNTGTICNTGTLAWGLDNHGIVYNYGTVEMYVSNTGTFHNEHIIGEVMNSGNFYNNGTVDGYSISNSGTLFNRGTLSFYVYNHNTIHNYGGLLGPVYNNGIIYSYPGSFIFELNGNPAQVVSVSPITTCYLTEKNTNEYYNGNINISVKTFTNSIEIELLEPIGSGNIKTILLNIDPDCILGVESDNTNVEWEWEEDKGEGNAGFGAMLTQVDRAPGNQQTVQYVKIIVDCEWDGVLPKNDNGYSVVLHVTRLPGAPESIWMACSDGSSNNGGNGGSQEIPEFPTIALPMIAILGLALFFKRRQ
ncbi:beta strand repeat-containing protein [Methanolobus psychrophilus R15]|nr:beta strand repeat-containing protein [Methanolobus psychrophilus R15]